jgi:LmbE family N-acetylglucosaminyl deacetylase
MSSRFRTGSPLLVFILVLLFLVPTTPSAQLRVAPVGERPGDVSLELLLRKLSSTGTFMQTDAHPDDEDNGLLAMLGLGQGMRATLVTATRGDGGQNEIGPELFQSLGVLRTEELLAVHRFDGAEQYFTRAIDFGYSFSVEESIEKWGRDAIVGDFVRQIRAIRPDVIAGFLCGGEGGGQHHQASARLTLEAFRAAADPSKYPEQIKEGLRPWQASRIFCTDVTAFMPNPPPPGPDMLKVDVSAFDPLLGRTYDELGLEARSMHKCQGTSQLLLLPGQPQSRTYKLWDSTLDRKGIAPPNLFAGIDVSLHGLMRVHGPNPPPGLASGLDAIAARVADARRALHTGGPAAAVAPLAAGLRAVRDLRKLVASTDTNKDGAYEVDFRLAQKERQFEDALVVAAGTRLDALADDGVVTPGQGVNVTIYATAAASGSALQAVKLAGFDGSLQGACEGTLEKGRTVTCKGALRIPAGTHLSTPYWTPRTDAARYDFEPDVPFGVPFRPSPFVATFDLTIGGAAVTVDRTVQYRYSNLVAGEKRSQLNVSPAFDVRVDPDIAVFPTSDRTPKTIEVTVGNNQKGKTTAVAALRAPAGWTVQPASAPIAFSLEDDQVTQKFTVSPPAGVTPGEFSLSAIVTGADGIESHAGYQVVEYPHIHRRHVVQEASTRVKVLDVKVGQGLNVGYVMGVGDRVPDAIEQLGVPVRLLDADMLASGDLSQFNVIMLGVRAYERRQDLRANNQRLLDYASHGGAVIVQYQRAEFNAAQYGPYPAKTSSDRITDENAPIEVLQPQNPIFTTPNHIGPATWANWVQERGTYFLGQRDPQYVDLLRSTDPFPLNPGAKTGIMVEAHVGDGLWIYTGLGLWRQLPAGTDGAYQLLANLISLHGRAR